MRLLLATQLIEVINQHLDLSRRGPVLHLYTIDDRAALHVVFVLLDVRMIEVDGQEDVAAWAVWGLILERSNIVFSTSATEFVVAARANWFFGCLVADAADEDILTACGVLFEDEIRVVCYLTHLHDQAKDVGVIVEHNTTADIGVECSSHVGHDAGGEVPLDLAEELIVDDNFLWWELHRCCVVSLHASKHDTVCHEAELVQSLATERRVLPLSDRVEQFLIEDRNMVEASMVAGCTFLALVLVPMKFCTGAFLAEVTRERSNL